MFTVDKAFLQRWLIPIVSAAVLFAVILFVFPYNSGDTSITDPLGIALWKTWTTSDPNIDYSYCLLVPIMVAFLLYERGARIAREPVHGNSAALAVILLGLVLFWLGSRAGKQYLGCSGLQVLVLGVIYWFWGGHVFRKLLFVWAILAFAWPLPFLDTAVLFPLRMIVSHLAYDALNVLQIPTVQDGTALISAPNPARGLELGARFQIDIADPCSGLHSLLPNLMFAAFYSYFFMPRLWQKWTVFLSGIPFAIAGNVIRIILLVLGSLLYGTMFAIGTNDQPSRYHEACGFGVFVVVLGFECLFGLFLTRAWGVAPPGRPAAPALPPPTGDVPAWRSATLLGLAAAMALVCWATPPVYLPSEAGVVMDLPDQVKVPGVDGGHFSGLDAPVTDVEHRVLPPDTEFARKNYDDFHDHQVFFSIVLSGLQQYTIHPPEVCLVAQGWTIVRHDDIPIQLASGHEIVVRNLSIQREAMDPDNIKHLIKAYYMYWYVADGITTPSHVERNWLSSWDRIVHNRDHRWAYVIAMSAITQTMRPDGLDADQTRQMLTGFIRQIVPTFQKNEIPGYTADTP